MAKAEEKMTAVQTQVREKVMAVLTPERRKTVEEKMKKARGGAEKGDGAKKPRGEGRAKQGRGRIGHTPDDLQLNGPEAPVGSATSRCPNGVSGSLAFGDHAILYSAGAVSFVSAAAGSGPASTDSLRSRKRSLSVVRIRRVLLSRAFS